MSETVTIVSLAPYKALDFHHNLGYFVIPAREEGQPYAKLVVKDATAVLRFGDNINIPQPVKAMDLAEDLIGKHAGDNLEPHGVFIAKGDEPTEKELAAAKKKMEEFYKKKVDEADSDFARFGDRKRLTIHAHAAAKHFGLKRPWLLDLAEMAACEGCKELIDPEAVSCPKCRAIRDWEKARKLGLVSQEQYTFATGKAIDAPRAAAAGR